MFNRSRITACCGALAVTVWACDEPTVPQAQTAALAPAFHVGCPAGTKFTGGGRIDPDGEKWTFGFNLHAADDCEDFRGRCR